MLYRAVTVIVISLFLSAFSDSELQRKELFRSIKQHEVRYSKYWKAARESNEIVVESAPEKLCEYISLINKLDGSENYKVEATKEFSIEDIVADVIHNLPPKVKSHLNNYCSGVYLVTNLNSSAFSNIIYETVLSDSSLPPAPVSSYIVLDIDLLNKPINEWASYRGNLPFDQEGDSYAQHILSESEDEDNSITLRTILLHEIGHLVGIFNNYHPNFDYWQTSVNMHSFSKISWKQRRNNIR